MRILLIEDNDSDAALISAYLAEARHEPPQRAADLVSALAALARDAYDAVLLDLSLPDAHGDEVVSQVLPLARDAALVVLSGDERDETARAALRRGALDYVRKGDIGPEALDRALRYALERRDARRAIAASEARYRTIVESLPDSMVFVYDRDLICTFAGGPGLARFNRPAHEIEGQPLDVAVPAEMLPMLTERYRAALAGEPQSFEYAAAGRPRALWLDLAPERDANGEITGVLCLARDVTRLREQQAALTEVRERYRVVVDALPVGVMMHAADGRIMAANPAVERILGITRAALEASPIGPAGWHALDGNGAPLAPDEYPIARALRGDALRDELLAIVRGDGRRAWLRVNATPLHRPGEGTPYAAIVSFNDISARIKVEQELVRQREALAEAQAIAQVGSFAWDLPAGALETSAELGHIYGFSGAGESAASLLANVPEEDRPELEAALARLAAHGTPVDVEHRVIRPGGGTGIVQTRAEAVRDEAGRPVRVVGTSQDITARRGEELARRAAEARFQAAFEQAPIGMALLDRTGHLLEVNPALTALCGYPRSELQGTGLAEIAYPDDAPALRDTIRALFARELEDAALELRLLHAGGYPVWVSVTATVIEDDEAGGYVLAHVQDVTERRRFEDQLRHMADHDPLTGLLNRRSFESELERHLAHVRRYGRQGALLVLDLDHFKYVNDTLGHHAGDELIVAVAGALRARLRETDVVARLGGDEFAILLTSGGAPEAETVARALLEAVPAEARLITGTRPRGITASVGIALFEDPQATADEMLVNADLAMYDAKEAGRARLALYSSGEHDEPRIKARMAWMERIHRALEDDGLVLYAQPILDLHTNRIAQHELLVRMLDEHGDAIPPSAFLYVAERFDLVQDIDRWVLRKAIELLGRSGADNQDRCLAVNLSGRSLAEPELARLIEDELQAHGVAPHQLVLEVTETAAVADLHRARRFAERVRSLGCRVSIDDFGAGFGSFSYLKHLPFDFLKIDGEFVTNALTGRADQLIIEAVIGIARGLGKETIAEFAGDRRTLRYLQKQGVDLAQGNHVGAPRPVEEALELEPQ